MKNFVARAPKAPPLPENHYYRPSDTARDFRLTQRMTRRATPAEHKTGIDRLFELDYMGASEFEGGIAFTALAHMRAAGDLAGVADTVYTKEGNEYEVFLVGPRAQKDTFHTTLQDWVNEGCESMEFTHFLEHLTGQETYRQVDVWWPFNARMFMTLDDTFAVDLLAALKG